MHAAFVADRVPVNVTAEQNLKKSLLLDPYRQWPVEKPETSLQAAVLEQEGRHERVPLPMQASLAQSLLLRHGSPGAPVAPVSGSAQTQTSCVGPGAETVFSRHVPPPHSLTLQHVSKQRAVPPSGFSQSPERQSPFTVHVEPPLFPPVAGGMREASVAGTQ